MLATRPPAHLVEVTLGYYVDDHLKNGRGNLTRRAGVTLGDVFTLVMHLQDVRPICSLVKVKFEIDTNDVPAGWVNHAYI